MTAFRKPLSGFLAFILVFAFVAVTPVVAFAEDEVIEFSKEEIELNKKLRDACAQENLDFTVIEDRTEAIEYVIKNAQKGDIILLAGKGHEEYEIDKKGKRRFCEKEIVAEAAGKLLE